MSWCFGLINNRLAEIYFEKNRNKIKLIGHCYVKKEDYKTKKEKQWIEEDTKKTRLVYRQGKYRLIE